MCRIINTAYERARSAEFASGKAQTTAWCARVRRSRGSAQRGAGAPLAGMRTRSRMWAHCYEVESRRTSRVRSPYMGPLFRRAVRPARGDAPPDPVREAPVREGALKAAIDVCETGRNASAPANGPAANGSQPHPAAGCLRTGTNAGLRTPTRSHPQRGPCAATYVVPLHRLCR
jgi:hypothetical protein